MAKITQQPTVSVEATFTVNEIELRALDALAGYGDDAFIKMFYKDLGNHYMKPYEAGLREFLTSIRTLAGPIIRRTDAARKEFTK
ncbi:MAG: hypothetical protein [Bacteriophage sp.]|nr:MAG: hypothetical protein [Bacteriophage sp.]